MTIKISPAGCKLTTGFRAAREDVAVAIRCVTKVWWLCAAWTAYSTLWSLTAAADEQPDDELLPVNL